jgi:flavodoxin I
VAQSRIVKAALLVESWTGNTWRAAEKVADLLQQEGWTITGLSKVKQPDYAALQAADFVLIGTWVHGAFFVGQAPWAANAIANLPAMSGKRAATFCTFALDPGKSLDKLSRAVGDTGAYVIGGVAMNRSKLDEHAEVFVDRLLDATATT